MHQKCLSSWSSTWSFPLSQASIGCQASPMQRKQPEILSALTHAISGVFASPKTADLLKRLVGWWIWVAAFSDRTMCHSVCEMNKPHCWRQNEFIQLIGNWNIQWRSHSITRIGLVVTDQEDPTRWVFPLQWAFFNSSIALHIMLAARRPMTTRIESHSPWHRFTSLQPWERWLCCTFRCSLILQN